MGPKSYSYETNNGEVTTKVKGFTLNYDNALKINADVMNEIIRDISKITIIIIIYHLKFFIHGNLSTYLSQYR